LEEKAPYPELGCKAYLVRLELYSSLMAILDLLMERLSDDELALPCDLAVEAAGECLQVTERAESLIYQSWEGSLSLAGSLHCLHHPSHGGHALLGGCCRDWPANPECVAVEFEVSDQTTHVSDHTNLGKKSLASLLRCAQM
jgi:hypothetical protein